MKEVASILQRLFDRILELDERVTKLEKENKEFREVMYGDGK